LRWGEILFRVEVSQVSKARPGAPRFVAECRFFDLDWRKERQTSLSVGLSVGLRMTA
jgi:hypothetical protein